MVASSCGDTLRRNRRDKCEQRRASDRSGRGLHRAQLGYMEPFAHVKGQRPSRGGSTIVKTVLGTLALISTTFTAIPAYATTPLGHTTPPASPDFAPVDFESALSAYKAGDYSAAFSRAKRAGNAGDDKAQVLAGTILMNGQAGALYHSLPNDKNGDDREAVEWFTRAAQTGNSDAQLALGKMALETRGGLSPSDALGFFSAASQAGRIEARRAIGEMYMKGIGIAPDADKGRSWMTQAADAGDNLGARKMGDTLIDSDAKAALVWYEKAAALGDADAAYIAALMYVDNLDIRPNSKRSAVLMRQAAEAGIAGAQADYGLLVYQGAGTDRSIDGAARWFEKSAKGGDKEGQFLYAFTLAKGEGVAQSYEDAYYWLLKSGKSGIDDYDNDRRVLRERLEANVDPATLARARSRAGM